jgi:hypothetical protein
MFVFVSVCVLVRIYMLCKYARVCACCWGEKITCGFAPAKYLRTQSSPPGFFSGVLQGCCRVLQGCCRGVKGVLQGVLQGCCGGVAGVLQRCYRGAIEAS